MEAAKIQGGRIISLLTISTDSQLAKVQQRKEK